jgi:hypothetical protein
MTKRIWLFIACLTVPVILIGLIFCFPTIVWVGNTDLKVEFHVTDRVTGDPIDDADVVFGSFHQDEREGTAFLKTDYEGKTSLTFRGLTSAGKENALLRQDTFSCNVPYWSYQVAANGFERTDLIPLRQHVTKEAIKRTGRGKSKIVVPVQLSKTGP